MISRIRSWLRSLGGKDELTLRRADFSIFNKTYAEQVAHGFRPRNGAPAYRLRLPLDWNINPFSDRNWCFHLHAWRMLDPIWGEYFDKDWKRLGDEVMPWVRDWHRYHVVEGREAAFSWYDMSVGLRAQHLAMLVHLDRQGHIGLGRNDRKLVAELAYLHHAKLRDRAFIAPNNHGVFQILGLRLLGVACNGWKGFEGEQRYSSTMALSLLRQQFDEHGVHVENSPDYHGLILKQFARLRPELFPDAASAIRKTVAKAKEILPWFTFPDGSIAALGDSEGLGAGWKGGREDHELLDADGRQVVVRDLGASGYVIVRSGQDVPVEDSGMLVMRGVSRSTTHAHADGMSILLFEHGRHLLVDSGKFSYGKDKWREYFTSDRAHNVVGVKGVRFAPQHLDATEASLSVSAVSDRGIMIEGRLRRRDWFGHQRTMAYCPGKCLEVSDVVELRAGDVPVAYWHLAPGLDAERGAGGVNIFDNGIQVMRLEVPDAHARARIVHGRETSPIQGWTSPRYHKKVAATVVEFQLPPGTTAFRTKIQLFAPGRREDAASLPRRLTHGVRFRFPHEFKRDRVALLPDGRTQRRVIVEVPGSAVLEALYAELGLKAFKPTCRQSERDGVVRRNFSHADGTVVTIKLRVGDPSGRDEDVHARCSLYFAWVRSNTSTDPGRTG